LYDKTQKIAETFRTKDTEGFRDGMLVMIGSKIHDNFFSFFYWLPATSTYFSRRNEITSATSGVIIAPGVLLN
jgi:hypothetical protein